MADQTINESSIKQSELRYRRLFEAAQDGILILDFLTGVIRDANPFIANLLGFTREELIGKELWEIGVIGHKTAALTAFTVLQDKGYVRYDDLPLTRKDGQVVDVEFVSNVYEVGNDRVIQCNIRDISDRKKLENKLFQYEHFVNVTINEMINTLANVIVARDPYTAGHQRRVADLAVAIATKMDLALDNVQGIRMAAMIHDIGKIGVPLEILTKPTALIDFEIQTLRNHVQAGYDIIKHVNFPWNVTEAVLQHHERIDGSGYPNGIKGDVICEEARIIAVADVVEAMSSDRPYRKGRGIDAALEEVAMGSGKQYDESVVNACLKLFKEDGYKFPSLF
jgi:PAS domain S-box-containing protein/putative nucleotidyltransferase with HDIG domain